MADIKPGPDLDRAVAEAIPCPARIVEGECQIGINYRTGSGVTGMWKPFSPSTDLNDSFWAAEQVGLFKKHLLGEWADGWSLGMNGVSSSPSPALAICAAILKLTDTS